MIAMPLDPKSPKVAFEKGYCGISCLTNGDKAQITTVPIVMWDRHLLSPELTIEEVLDIIYELSTKVWIDYELFNIWFTNHFYIIFQLSGQFCLC